MNHAVAGGDWNELHKAQRRGEIDSDWCVDAGNGCIDWKHRLKEECGPENEAETENHRAWNERYKDLEHRWKQQQEQRAT